MIQGARDFGGQKQKGSTLFWILIPSLVVLVIAFLIPHTSTTDSLRKKHKKVMWYQVN